MGNINIVAIPFQSCMVYLCSMSKYLFYCFLWVIALGPAALAAQRNYYDYAAADMKTIYFDDFDEDSRTKFWTGKNREHKGKIKYGQYLFKSVAMGLKPSYTAPRFDLDPSRNFSIEMKLSCNGNDYGLVWGQDMSMERFYYFNLIKRGFIIKNEREIIIKGKIKKLVKEWNKITLRKVEDTYYFFVNEQLVYELPYEPISNIRIGIGTPGWKVFVDYFGVYYLGELRELRN